MSSQSPGLFSSFMLLRFAPLFSPSVPSHSVVLSLNLFIFSLASIVWLPLSFLGFPWFLWIFPLYLFTFPVHLSYFLISNLLLQYSSISPLLTFSYSSVSSVFVSPSFSWHLYLFQASVSPVFLLCCSAPSFLLSSHFNLSS